MNTNKSFIVDPSTAGLVPIELHMGDQSILLVPKPIAEPEREEGQDSDRRPPLLESFELPKLPSGLIDWLTTLSHQFWATHHRCLASLLLLEAGPRTWAIGIPNQRCSSDSSCWTIPQRAWQPDLQEPFLLAGSFQIRILGKGEAAIDAVPPLDGVHLILQLHPKSQQQATIWSFVRCAGQVQQASREQTLEDQTQAALEACRPRLTLL